jgi:hypothetical protein
VITRRDDHDLILRPQRVSKVKGSADPAQASSRYYYALSTPFARLLRHP